MEGVPEPEKIPTKEEILDELKLKGLTNETMDMVAKWTVAREQEVKTARDGLILNIERIDFFLATGDIEGAWEDAQDAYVNAIGEGEEDLIQELLKRFPTLRGDAEE